MAEKMGPQNQDRDEAKPEQALAPTTQARISRRTNQVKVLLNEEELEQLDWIVERMGSDRSSVMRYLLSNVPKPERDIDAQDNSPNKTKEEEITRIRVGEIPGPWTQKKPCIRLFEPRDFDHIPQAVKAIRNGEAVVVNLTMMEPDQAQRAVDFVAGGAFYGEGHQERVGESIFLFASCEYEVSAIEVLKVIKGSDPQALEASDEIAISNDKDQSVPTETDSEGAISDGSEDDKHEQQKEEAEKSTASSSNQITNAKE